MKSEVIITADDLPADVIKAIERGRKIEAIKILRESKGIGLANAKVLIERAWQTHGPAKPIVSFADQSQGFGMLAKPLMMFLVIAAVYYFYKTS